MTIERAKTNFGISFGKLFPIRTVRIRKYDKQKTYGFTRIGVPIITYVSEFGDGEYYCLGFFSKHVSRVSRERNGVIENDCGRVVHNGRPRDCCVLNNDRRPIIEIDRDVIVKNVLFSCTRREIKNVNACLSVNA